MLPDTGFDALGVGTRAFGRMSNASVLAGNGGSSELPALTGLRGFAAIAVLLFHVWGLAGEPALEMPGIPALKGGTLLSFGGVGVDLFFCLSAFLLVLPYARWRYGTGSRPLTGRYLMRRVLRIYPAYLFQLSILLVAALFGYGHLPSVEGLVAHVFLWFNMGWNWVAPMVGVWFTLPIEFSFYLLLPLMAPLIDRRRWPWLLLGALVISVSFRFFMHLAYLDESTAIRVIAIERLPGRIEQFVIGMLAGTAFVVAGLRGWRPRSPDRWFWLGLAGVFVVCAALNQVVERYWAGHPLLFVWHALFSAAIVPVLLASGWNAKSALLLLANRPLRYLGDISFGVYLWHMPIVLLLLPKLPEDWSPLSRFWVLLALVLPTTLLVAHFSYRFIELPFLRRKPKHRP